MAIIEKTQCPHCKSTFKVQEAQLKAANGKVRCGACMNVFDAIAYGIPARPDAATEHPVRPRPASTHDPRQSVEETAAADDLEAILAEDAEEEMLISDDPQEDKDDETYSGNAKNRVEFSTEFANLDSDTRHYSNTFHTTIEDPSDKADESWAEEILDEIRADSQDEASFVERAFEEQQPATLPREEDNLLSDEFREATASAPKRQQPALKADKRDASSDELSAIDQQRVALEQQEKEKVVAFDDLRHQPLELEQEKARSPLMTFVWGILNLGLLGLLAGQVAWLYFDTLSRTPQLRPIYQIACQQLGCSLPELIDLQKIKSQNLVVRSHPTANRALIIDTTIVNDAAFDQDFPDIALSFSDINDKVIAERLFTRNEYLSGYVASWPTMPSHKPVHIGMEIVDPGKAAVNYSLKFFAAKKPE